MTKHLAVGGYALANDYLGNATWLSLHPEQFTLVGVINFEQMEKPEFSTDLTHLFESVENVAELQKFRPRYCESIIGQHEMFARMNAIGCSLGTPVKKILEVHLESIRELQQNLPYKRIADRYVFRKEGGE